MKQLPTVIATRAVLQPAEFNQGRPRVTKQQLIEITDQLGRKTRHVANYWTQGERVERITLSSPESEGWEG